MSLFLSAALALVPVAADDARLSQPDTFVSEAARAAIEADPATTLRCLDLTETKNVRQDVCLTAGEWQAVVEKTRANASAERRDQLVSRAQFLLSYYGPSD